MLKIDRHLIIGGASKCGTTALYDMLSQSGHFFLPDKKELHYFSYNFLSARVAGPGDLYVCKELVEHVDDYRNCFSDREANQITVDISPSYLFYRESADRILRTISGAQVVFILRNPVEKVFSQYVHLVSEGRETLSFEEALEFEGERKKKGFSDMWLYRESGLYAESIQYFIDILGRRNVKIFLYEELQHDMNEVLQEICFFAGAPESVFSNSNIIANRSGQPKSLFVSKVIAPNRFTTMLRRFLPRRVGRLLKRLVRDLNTGTKPLLSDDAADDLKSYYEADIKKLESVIGRKTGWLE